MSSLQAAPITDTPARRKSKDNYTAEDLRRLCRDLENTTKAPTDINFATEIADVAPEFYGAKSTEQRTRFSKKVSNYRRYPESYGSDLERFSIEPCQATRKFLLTASRLSSSRKLVKQEDDYNEYDDKDDDDYSLEEPDLPSPASSTAKEKPPFAAAKPAAATLPVASPLPGIVPSTAFLSPSVVAAPVSASFLSPSSHTPSRTSARTPIRSNIRLFRSPMDQQFSMMSIADQSAASMATATTLASDRRFGGAANPYLVHFDMDHPEAHMGFIVGRFDNVTHDNRVMDVIRIFYSVFPGDENLCQAVIPTDEEVGLEFLGNSVLVKVPALPFLATQIRAFNANTPTNNQCAATITQLNVNKLAMVKDEKRHYNHYLIVFPKEISLENYMLSSSDRTVAATNVMMKFAASAGITADHQNTFKVRKSVEPRNGVQIMWSVAVKDTSNTITENNQVLATHAGAAVQDE